MRTRRAESIALAILIAAAAMSGPLVGHDQIPAPPQERPILLQGGDLYTVSDGVLRATDLLIVDGEITAIGPSLEPPADAHIIDLTGQRVYPGLIALATTLGLSEIDAVRATHDLDERGEINPEVRALDAYNPDSEIVPTVRSEGITTAQVAPDGDLLRGRSGVLHLDGWTIEDSRLQMVDAIHLSWPAARIVESWWVDESPEEQRKNMERQRRELRRAFELARAYDRARDAGEEIETDSRWEAMRPLFSGELPLWIHADDYRQIVEALALAREFELEIVLAGGAEADQALELLAEAGVPVVLDVSTRLPMRPDEPYDAAYRLPVRLHEAGIPFAIGMLDENWEARNLAIEAAGSAIAFGLPPDVALASITLAAARILGIDDREGSLEVGKDGTVVVSRGDLLDTLGHEVTHMFIRGREIDLGNKQRTLYEKYGEKIRRFGSTDSE